MARPAFLSLLVVAMIAGPAFADTAIPIGDVTSDVFQTSGDQAAIARRGETCMARVLKPGVITAATIISADYDGGRIVGRNAFGYVEKGWVGVIDQQGRSVVTFEAKPGRFRISHTDIEIWFQIGNGPGEWRGAKAWSKKVDTDPERLALIDITARLAACVLDTGKSADW